jgi:uncharacterized Fe-S cluster-containing radical SAM superfamily protein
MGAVHFRTLVIETGVLCNNRCLFCYQKGYRGLAGFPKLVPGDEILRRMQWGLDNGFDEVSLTGGEPTIRPDFLDLVRTARSLGYRRVAVTTNGWRLADPDFFRDAIEAGLTSLGVSIHGASAETHDHATGHPGSFARALRTIRLAALTHGSSRPVRLNSFTVVHRQNVDNLHELADILHALGVRLMVFQPGILSKSNMLEGADTSVDLSSIVAGVRKVVLRGMERGFRVKLFNLPPCLFRDVLGGLDLDAYERATFREHDRKGAGTESRGEEVGYVRLHACDDCTLKAHCPGVHVTLLPQEDLSAHLESAIGAISAHEHSNLWIAGTDLLKGGSLARVVRKARLAGFPDIKVTTGGSGIARRALYIGARQGGASEVVLVHHPRDPGSSDRIVCHAGNDQFLHRAIADLATVPRDSATDIGLLVSVGPEALELLRSPEMEHLGVRGFTLHIRPTWRHSSSPSPRLLELTRFLKALSDLDLPPRQVIMEVPRPRLWEAFIPLPLAALAAGGRLRYDLTATVLPTSFLDPKYSVLNWSLPHLGGQVIDTLTNRPLEVREIRSAAIRARPITREALLAARRPYGHGFSAAPPGPRSASEPDPNR